MTTTTSLTAPAPTTADDPWRRRTALLGGLAGGALVVDTVTITVVNRSFDPLDSVLFLAGLVGMLLTLAALALSLSRGRTGASRAGVAVGAFLAAAVVLGAVSTAADAFGHATFSADNKGLHGEWSFFSIGVCLLALAAWAARGRRRT